MKSFAIATVVARRSPVSSHLGDRAIVFADGRIVGFVGGACARDVVRRHALDVMRTGKPRLLQIRPDAQPGGDAELAIVPMSCASEGSVDIYIEPHGRRPRLLVAGFTPVADGLTRLATALEYDVIRVVAEEEIADVERFEGVRSIALDELPSYLESLETGARDSLCAVVASQGQYDEDALEPLLRVPLGFVGLLASRRRGASVKAMLRERGVDAAALERMHTPVGLDIGARGAGEVAVSILAEIVQFLAAVDAPTKFAESVTAIDPVCGMDVEIADARATLEHDGETYRFCSSHCRAAFAADPARFAAIGTAGTA